MSEKKTRTIVKQVLITTYSDGSVKVTEMKVGKRTQQKRDERGRFEGFAKATTTAEVTPDEMVTCPYCGRAFRVGSRK